MFRVDVDCPVPYFFLDPKRAGDLRHARESYTHKNAFGRTTANRAGDLLVTRCDFGEKARLSSILTAGNTAGNFHARFPNTLIPSEKTIEFEQTVAF